MAGVSGVQSSDFAGGPIIVFSDSFDQRSADLFAWAEDVRGPCKVSMFGGPGYGIVEMHRCR